MIGFTGRGPPCRGDTIYCKFPGVFLSKEFLSERELFLRSIVETIPINNFFNASTNSSLLGTS